eukprot:scaffold135244_cov84-Phaeocystis_antarctica.AAC.3
MRFLDDLAFHLLSASRPSLVSDPSVVTILGAGTGGAKALAKFAGKGKRCSRPCHACCRATLSSSASSASKTWCAAALVIASSAFCTAVRRAASEVGWRAADHRSA